MAGTMVELIQEGKDIIVTLTDSEKVRFEECKQIIGKNLKAFLEVGCALADIRDNRLYRETHEMFEAFCKETWDLSKTHINRKIAGYSVVQDLTPMTPMGVMGVKNDSEVNPESEQPKIILPINERQARPLTRLKKPADRVKAWDLVREQINNDGKKQTTALISKAVKEVRGEVFKRNIDLTKKQIDSTQLVSTIFKKQAKVLTEIVREERNTGWKTTSKKEAIKYLQGIIKTIEWD